MIKRIFLTEEEAIDLLPDGDQIHTFYNPGFGLLGADWDREEIIDKIHSCDIREVTGKTARGMRHGLALFTAGCSQGDILFVETNMEKLNSMYPEENKKEK